MKDIRFIKIDGCINCGSYNYYQDKKIQLHEAMASCVLFGCQKYGHTILYPYIGNHELEYILENKVMPSGNNVTDDALDRIKQILRARMG